MPRRSGDWHISFESRTVCIYCRVGDHNVHSREIQWFDCAYAESGECAAPKNSVGESFGYLVCEKHVIWHPFLNDWICIACFSQHLDRYKVEYV